MVGSPAARWRVGGAVAATALWLLALVHFRDWVAHNDFAIFRLDLERQLDGDVRLVGAYSRLDVFHPGPLREWTFVLPYLASGRRAASLPATALVLNAAWVAWGVATARRAESRVGRPAALAIVAGMLVLVVAVGPNLASPWNPHLAILPMFVAWSAAAVTLTGDRRCWPAAVVGASFAAQLHASALIGGVVVLVAVGARLAADAFPASGSAATDGSSRRALAAAAVTLALWSGPLVDLRRGADANLVRLATVGADGDRVGLAEALGHVSRLLWPPAVLSGDAIRPTADLFTGWSRLLVLAVAVLIVATWATASRSDRPWPAGAMVALTVAVVSVAFFVEPPFPYLYGAMQATAVFAVTAGVVAGLRSAGRSQHPLAGRVPDAASRLALPVLAVATAVPFLLVPADDHESADRRALGVEAAVVAVLDDHPAWEVVAVVGADMRAAIVEAEIADVVYRSGRSVHADRVELGLPPIEGDEPLLVAAMGEARACLLAAGAGVDVILEGIVPAVGQPVIVAAVVPRSRVVAACELRPRDVAS